MSIEVGEIKIDPRPIEPQPLPGGDQKGPPWRRGTQVASPDRPHPFIRKVWERIMRR